MWSTVGRKWGFTLLYNTIHFLSHLGILLRFFGLLSFGIPLLMLLEGKKSSLLSSSAGEFSVEHQQCKSNFPWLFSSCLHKEAEKIGRRPCWAFQKNDAWYTTHYYEAHDLTYIKSLLLTPKNTHQKLKWIHVIKFFWKNKIIRPELSTSKKSSTFTPQIYGHVADILLPFFWRVAIVYWVLHTWPHNGHVYSFVMTKESTQYYTKNL